MARTDVVINDHTYAVSVTRGIKVFIAPIVVGQVMGAVHTVLEKLAEFEQGYGDKYKTRRSRQEVADDIALTKAALDQIDEGDEERRRYLRTQLLFFEEFMQQMGDQYVEYPKKPSGFELLAVGLPEAMALAPKQVLQLFGLAVIEVKDLIEAYRNDSWQDLLEAKGQEVVFEAEFDELLPLAVAVVEQSEERLTKNRTMVGKLRAAAERMTGREPKTTEQETTKTETPTPSSPKPSPLSSIPSPAPSTGESTTSSESATTSSSPSPAA